MSVEAMNIAVSVPDKNSVIIDFMTSLKCDKIVRAALRHLSESNQVTTKNYDNILNSAYSFISNNMDYLRNNTVKPALALTESDQKVLAAFKKHVQQLKTNANSLTLPRGNSLGV